MRPYATIRFEKRGAVAIVTLDRPQSLNAYNVAMRDDLDVWLPHSSYPIQDRERSSRNSTVIGRLLPGPVPTHLPGRARARRTAGTG